MEEEEDTTQTEGGRKEGGRGEEREANDYMMEERKGKRRGGRGGESEPGSLATCSGSVRVSAA